MATGRGKFKALKQKAGFVGANSFFGTTLANGIDDREVKIKPRKMDIIIEVNSTILQALSCTLVLRTEISY